MNPAAAQTENRPPALPPAPPPQPAARNGGDGDGFGFWDLLDIVNPLQHLPLVGPVYRELTGDEISSVSKVAGGGLFGGVIGLAASTVDVLIKETTGRDVGAHVMAALGIGGEEQGRPLPDAAVLIAAPETDSTQFAIARARDDSDAVAETLLAQRPGAAPGVTIERNAGPAGATPPLAAAALPKGAVTVPDQPASAPAPQRGRLDEPQARSALASHFTKARPEHLQAQRSDERLRAFIGDPALFAQKVRDETGARDLRPGTAGNRGDGQARQGSSPDTTRAGRAVSGERQDQGRGQAQTVGGSRLPPQLVADMMTMALEKYERAGGRRAPPQR